MSTMYGVICCLKNFLLRLVKRRNEDLSQEPEGKTGACAVVSPCSSRAHSRSSAIVSVRQQFSRTLTAYYIPLMRHRQSVQLHPTSGRLTKQWKNVEED